MFIIHKLDLALRVVGTLMVNRQTLECGIIKWQQIKITAKDPGNTCIIQACKQFIYLTQLSILTDWKERPVLLKQRSLDKNRWLSSPNDVLSLPKYALEGRIETTCFEFLLTCLLIHHTSLLSTISFRPLLGHNVTLGLGMAGFE